MIESARGIECDPVERGDAGDVGKAARVLARGIDTLDANRNVQPQKECVVTNEIAPRGADMGAGRNSDIGLSARILVVATGAARKRAQRPARVGQIQVRGAGDQKGAVAARSTQVENAGYRLPALPRRVCSRAGDGGRQCQVHDRHRGHG